eukprot:5884509-Amphidinium_carterae.1
MISKVAQSIGGLAARDAASKVLGTPSPELLARKFKKHASHMERQICDDNMTPQQQTATMAKVQLTQKPLQAVFQFF